MNADCFSANRARMAEKMADGSALIVFSGRAAHCTMDQYHPFWVNRNFYYLTGIDRESFALIMVKNRGEISHYLFIEPESEEYKKWLGCQMTGAEAGRLSGVENALDNTRLERTLHGLLNTYGMERVYLDIYRNRFENAPSRENSFANILREKYPDIAIMNCNKALYDLRTIKAPWEVERIQRAIDITAEGIARMMGRCRPGAYEYELEAEFDYALGLRGVGKTSFASIVASGINGCALHYAANRSKIGDGALVLCDLGAVYQEYCADITRTFPASGQFTPRQAQLYEIVLSANKLGIACARPGATAEGINQEVRAYVARRLVDIGLIPAPEEVDRYYLGIGHTLGLDVHDPGDRAAPFAPGCVHTIEPGLYIREEGIGIRIEDDVLITGDGCQVLSGGIAKELEDIEAMVGHAV